MDDFATPLSTEDDAPARSVPFGSLDLAMQSLLDPIRETLARIEARLTDGDFWDGRSPPAAFARSETSALRERTIDAVDCMSPGNLPTLETGTVPQDMIWEEILLGSELCQNAELHAQRREFLRDVVDGVVAARTLAGQLMLIQSATVDEIPELLNHVGTAYYRWRPRVELSEAPLERALADWLTRRVEAAGLRNSIQLVRPGDRFDSSRHAGLGRGVEVIAVHGWIVLRDNHKVYTKATVSLK